MRFVEGDGERVAAVAGGAFLACAGDADELVLLGEVLADDLRREAAVVVVAGLLIAPNIVPAAITTQRGGGMPGYWFEAMEWLRTNTPEPFASPDYYYARYQPSNTPARFSIMNWWDQGYWIIQTARRSKK